MKNLVIYLWISSFQRITYLLSSLKNGFTIKSLRNCQLRVISYIDAFCQGELPAEINQHYKVSRSVDFTINVYAGLSYMLLESDNEPMMIAFYYLPAQFIEMPIDYHRWKWGGQNTNLLPFFDQKIKKNDPSNPGLILIPNLKNNPEYYIQLKFKELITIDEKQIKNHVFTSLERIYIHPRINFRFYLDARFPITIYNSNNQVILGENLKTGQYIEISESIDPYESYYISCNDLISHRTQPIIRVLLGVYKDTQLFYSDYLIFRIAPAILIPNSQTANIVYLANIPGMRNNDRFRKEIGKILDIENYECQTIKNNSISMYHRWMQDIFKFAYCTDGEKIQYIILKGPHFSAHSFENGNISYIYDFFKDYPLYDFFFETDKNLDGLGNVQVIPPIYPSYPLGRIIYGISRPHQHNQLTNIKQNDISYNLSTFLESQEIQKPIQVNTGWLSVGHVDEILSYVPDSQHKYGFRILIASPRKFLQLISKLDKNTIIFDNVDNYYIFDEITTEIRKRFDQKYEDQNIYHCVYKTQLGVDEIINWSELNESNEEYQYQLDEIRLHLMKELDLDFDDFYEIPIYYWPRSISKLARSIIPNMINNLFLKTFMIVAKPYGPIIQGNDLFETYFKSQIPEDIKVNFVKNWDSYYLLEGDINCGTNTKRRPFKKKWWNLKPDGAYDI